MLFDVFVLFDIQFFDANVGCLSSFEQTKFVDHIERNTCKFAVVHLKKICREELAIGYELFHLEQLDVLGTVQFFGLNQIVFDVGIVNLPVQRQKNVEFHLPEHSLVVFAFGSAKFHELVEFGNTISLCGADKPASSSVSQIVDSFCVGELFGILNVDKVVISTLDLGGYPETGGDYKLGLVQENYSGGAVAVEKCHRFTYNKRDYLQPYAHLHAEVDELASDSKCKIWLLLEQMSTRRIFAILRSCFQLVHDFFSVFFESGIVAA